MIVQAAVGLGNPGARYAGTRHNLGFRVVDLLADDLGGDWTRASTYLFCEVACASKPLLLVKPMVYMNNSGAAVGDALLRFGIALEDTLVVVDDVYLDLGCVRLRRKGSDGGHNGLASIIEAFGAAGFPRLRMGVGMPPEGMGLVAYVLNGFDEGELDVVERSVRTAADGVACWTALGLDAAMNRYNS